MTIEWQIAIAGFVVTITITLLGLGIKALWDIAKTFRELVTKHECNQEMGKHCDQIKRLERGFEENKSAISQMVLAFWQLHKIKINYKH